jgi:hypothetical protein
MGIDWWFSWPLRSRDLAPLDNLMLSIIPNESDSSRKLGVSVHFLSAIDCICHGVLTRHRRFFSFLGKDVQAPERDLPLLKSGAAQKVSG